MAPTTPWTIVSVAPPGIQVQSVCARAWSGAPCAATAAAGRDEERQQDRPAGHQSDDRGRARGSGRPRRGSPPLATADAPRREVEEEAEERKQGDEEERRLHVNPLEPCGSYGKGRKGVKRGQSGLRGPSDPRAGPRRAGAVASRPPGRPGPPRAARQVDQQTAARRAPPVPGTARRGASGPRPRARSSSAIPGASRSRTSNVASGVTSRGPKPVPPVVTTRRETAAASRRAATIADGSSGTTRGPSTSNPPSPRRRHASGPETSSRSPRAQPSLTVITVARSTGMGGEDPRFDLR